jgi:hypothetical protein
MNGLSCAANSNEADSAGAGSHEAEKSDRSRRTRNAQNKRQSDRDSHGRASFSSDGMEEICYCQVEAGCAAWCGRASQDCAAVA